MQEIGIFFANYPQQPVKNQGIGRLLGFILSGMLQEPNVKAVIALPTWYKEKMLDFLNELHLDMSRIELLETGGIPYAIRLLNRVSKRDGLSPAAAPAMTTNTRSIAYLKRIILNKFKKSSAIHKLYDFFREAELRRLIKKINARKNITAWFVPTPFWPEVKWIKAKKIIAVPDLVQVEFPAYFTKRIDQLMCKKMRAVLSVGDHFICYSDHVKTKHLVEHENVAAEKISVITHGAVMMDEFFSASETNTQRQEMLVTLTDYQLTLAPSPLKQIDFRHTCYLFYSSQVRPYKNLFNLVKATEALIKERGIEVKLILTGNVPADDKLLFAYIKDKKLEQDVLFASNVSSKVLAALNALAVCAVNPSLFEGGFPFTFTEAYSVGTPSVMSRIGVTQPWVNTDLAPYMLFDPYNLQDMIEKLHWAILHKDELYKMEQSLYQEFKQRTWEIAAGDYVAAIKQVAEGAS